jgi:hypothetical protein
MTILRYRYQSPDDPGSAADVIEVELGGVKIPLPKDTAKSVIEYRDKMKTTVRETAEKLGQFEAQAKAAAEAEKKARDDAEMAALKSKGEVDEIIRRVKEQESGKVNALATKYRDRALESMIAKTEGIIPEAVNDICRALASTCNYDIESDALTVLDAAGKPRLGGDGKPISADALVKEFLDARPYFRKASGSPGSGATGGGKPSGASASKITQAEYGAAMRDPARSQQLAQDIAAKRVVIEG